MLGLKFFLRLVKDESSMFFKDKKLIKELEEFEEGLKDVIASIEDEEYKEANTFYWLTKIKKMPNGRATLLKIILFLSALEEAGLISYENRELVGLFKSLANEEKIKKKTICLTIFARKYRMGKHGIDAIIKEFLANIELEINSDIWENHFSSIVHTKFITNSIRKNDDKGTHLFNIGGVLFDAKTLELIKHKELKNE